MKKLYNIFMNKVMPMRTAFVVLFVMLVLCGTTAVKAQTNITIGTGTNTNYYPLPGLWGWQYDVYIYDAADINTAGYITKLAYNISSVSSNSSTSSFQIYMKDVESSYTLNASTTFASYISGASLVYSNSAYSTPSTGWNTFTLTNQFCHDASKSLMIAVRGVGCGTSGGCSKSVYYTSATSKHWHKHVDSSDPGTSVSGTIDSNRSNIILTFNGSCSSSSDPCSNVTPMSCGVTYSGTLGTSGVWSSYTSSTYSEPGEERVYSFTPTISGEYTFTGTNDGGDADFFLMSSCGTSGTNMTGGNWSLGSRTVTLTAGTTYYLIADNYSSSNTASYTISVTCPASDCEDVTIGTGTDCSNLYAPVNDYWNYNYRQIIYPATSLTPGAIYSLSFQYCYTTAMSSKTSVNIYMGHTSQSAFGSSTSWVAYSDLTLVYSGPLNCSNGWNTFNLNTPFQYNGVDNLVLAIDDNSGDYDGSAYTFYYSAGSGNVMLTYNSDGTNPDPSSPPSGTLYSNYPNTKFCIESNCTPRTLSFDNSTINIASCSGTASQTARISPNAGGTITWRSSNPSVAEVSSSGVVTAHSLGTAVITATVSLSGDYCPATGSYTVNVTGSSHTLTYNTTANCSGGTASTAPASVTGTSATVTSTEPTCSNRPYFLGWNTAANGTGTHYSAGTTVDLACADVTLYAQYSTQPPVITGSPDCENAQAFCASNDNTGYDLEVEGDQDIPYPSGMCMFFVNPTWWYLRISDSGPIEMEIASSCGDVDFGCWGPFDNPTCDITNDLNDNGANGFTHFSGSSYANLHSTYNPNNVSTTSDTENPICVTGALASPSGNLVDFGGSTSDEEYLQIPNAQEGQIYVVLIANYADCAGNITFVQSNITNPNAGRSDCTIVNDCAISSITTIVGDCAGDQTFSISGNINFTDPPVDGTLTISDGTVSQVFTPPFVSPISYSLSGIQGDGQEHTITAAFASSTTNCEKITYIDAPMCEIDCPDATVAMTGYTEVIGDRYYFDVCLRSGVNMNGTQTGYTNPTWTWSINPHGGQTPYVINGQTASYTPANEQGYDVSLTVTEGQCSSVAYGRIRVSGGLTTSLTDYALGEVCVGDSREVTIGGTGSDIQVNPEPHSIETSLGHAEETFIPDGLNCSTQCYESSVTFYDFDDGAVVTNADAIKYIKLNTEHSFIGDIQIKITCPNGREAIILQDYYSSDANSNVYSSNAIDAYTYSWPTSARDTAWLIGTSSTVYYTSQYMLPRIYYTSDRDATYVSEGVTYYQPSFDAAAEAWYFIENYLNRWYAGHTYSVYYATDDNNNTFYFIGYEEGDDTYIVWLDRITTTDTNAAFRFSSQSAAQSFARNVYGTTSVTYTSIEGRSYHRIYFGEPDIYDIVDGEDLTSAEICNENDEHNISGVGYDYAWTSSSQYTTVGYVYDVANMVASSTVYNNGTAATNTLYHVLPSNADAGTQMYQPYQSFGNLSGCPLNGTWTISVCDSWAKDNGYVFDWEIALSEDLLPSNWDYTVDLDGVSTNCGSIATVSGNNLIVAPQTATNGEQSCYIVLSDNLGCTTNIPMTYTAVAPTITHVATSGNEMQTVCENQPITDIVYTLGGSAVSATATGLPAGVTITVSGNTVTISGAPSAHDTYNYNITTVSANGLHCTEVTATGRIIVNEGDIVPTFAQAGPYCEGTTVADLPTTSTNGITGQWTPNITNSTNTYTFTPDAGQCATITTMQITVNPLPTITYTSGSETLCKGETNANIVFTYGGGANGADVTGLPTGMEFNTNVSAHQIVISGTPTAAAGTYNYTITTTGATSPCSNISLNRTITIIEPATLELTSGDQSQTVCEGDAVNFVYTYGGSAGGATASNLPSGLTATTNTTNHTITISGTPTEGGTFTVTTSNVTAPCGDVSLTGTIVVTNPAELTLLSASPDAVLCQGAEWEENIQYEFGGTATGATVTGLPAGLTYSTSGNVVTISGTATAGAGSYDYTITTTSDASSPCPPKTLTGTIEISTNATLVLTSAENTDNQILCLPNQTFSTIVYTYGGGATGAEYTEMPAGLTATVNTTAHTVTITGTPTEVGEYYYTITTTGTIASCKPASVSGEITIGIEPTLDVTGNRNQSFCLGNDLSDIVFTYGGGATGVSVTGTLPAGVSSDTDNGAQTLTLSGTPTETGTFSITVTTIGSSDSWNPCEEKSFPVTINVYDTPDVSINASATEICNGSSVNLSSQPATFSTYRWTCNTTSDATYTVSPGLPTSVTVSAISVSPTVTPGSTDVEYNLRVTDANGCSAEVQQIITVSATPTADVVNEDNTRCTEPYNGSITVSNFAGGLAGSTYTVAVTGQASQTTTGASVVFGALEAGSYTVTITNESTLGICITEQTITIGDNQSSPSVDISGPLSICEGTNTTLTAHASGGEGTIVYSWSTGASGTEITTPNLTTATPYSVTVTDENGCSASDEVEVQIGDAPSVEAVATTPICFGDQDVLIANVHNAGTGYTLEWSADPIEYSGLVTTTGERITVTPPAVATITYTVTLTTTACGGGAPFIISDDVTVVVNDLPKPNIINLSNDVVTITCSTTEINVEATGGTSYVWSNGVDVAANTFTDAGVYTVTVSSADACTASAQVQIYRDVALPNVSISASPSTELTCANPTITLTASTTTDGATLSWTTMDVTVPNVYSVTATGSNDCPATAEIEITSDDNVPTVSIDEPSTVYLTCTNQSITLTATGQGTLTWSPSNVATAEGDYIVTARADNGCESSDVIHIFEDNDLPNVEITPSAPALTCTVQTITLQASGAANYVWNGVNTGASLTITEGGDYTVVGTAANGCSDTETITIGQDAGLPDVSITPSTATLTCSVNSVALTAVADPGIVFDWGDVDPTNITEPGTYSVTATAPNGCQRVATATVVEDRENPDVAITTPATTVLNCNNSYNNIPITLEATTSTTGASLSWTNGTLDVTTPGHYSVTATASNDCESTAEIDITEDVAEPNVAIGNNSNTTVLTCAGPSISVTLIDDSDADDYVWSGGENLTGTGNSFTSPGHYYVTATAPNGCTSEAEIHITEDVAQPTVSITNNTGTSVLSCDISTISVTAVGSDRVVSYRWSGGTYTNQASNEFTTIGTYVVTATADNGCTATASIEITETMGRPNVAIDAPDPAVLTCTTTQIPITATGDAVSYVWSGGMYPDAVSNIVENTGVYTVTATAANGCTAVASISITENLTPPTVSIRNESGFNQIDCRATSVHAVATGTGVSYIWPGGHEGAEIDLTAAGTYTVTAYGANGCPNTAYVVITEDFTPPTPNITSANSQYIIDCNNDELTLNATGGVTYLWSTHDTGPTIIVTEAGIYRVTATGINGCPGETEIVIDANNTLPNAYIDNLSGTNSLSCNVTSIEVIAQGGTQYAWNNAQWAAGASQTITNPGTYIVTVTGRNGCSASTSITIGNDNDLPNVYINSTTNLYELNCSVSRINVTASGNGISYAWSGGSNTTGYTNVFTNPGTYTVTAAGSNGCNNTATVTITSNYSAPDINISNESGTTVLDCNTPQIHVVVTGQDATYLWHDGYTTADRTFYSHGQYTVTATGANGCSASLSIGITENMVLPTVSITNNTGSSELNCINTSISLTANGGQSYAWNDGTMSPTNAVSTPGLYTVTATAANGCTNTATVTISQAPVFNAEITNIGTINCYGESTSVTVTATGGNPAYSYEWSDGQNTQTATGLLAGSYTVTVRDSGGCSAALQCNVTQPLEMQASVVSRDLICGVSQGSLNAVVIGGTQPYSYTWSNGATTAENTNVIVGQYGLTVVDINNCMATASAQVSRQGMLSVNAHVTQQISCHGYNDGIVAAEAPNAAEPLFYTWNTGNASPEIYNLFEGSYMVTVTDAWGCTGQAGVNLVSPPEMNLQTYTEAPLCHDSRDGKIIATAFGGVAPYTYLWNTSSTENELSNVGMGTYSLTISDAAGCSAVKSVTLEAPAAIIVETSTSEIRCNGDKDGKIEVEVSGGVEPYSYSIDGLSRPSTSSVFSNMTAGYYTVRIVDNNGCAVAKPTLLSQPDVLQVETLVENPFCRGSRTGSIELRATGGTEPYMYYWNNSKGDVSIMQNMYAGEYVVGVIDGNECKSEEITITLTDVDVPCLRIPNVFTPNGDGVNDTWEIVNIEMFPEAEIYVFNRWGQLMFTSKGYTEPWDGRYRGHFVPAGTFMYIIDLFNDEEPYEGTVTIIY